MNTPQRKIIHIDMDCFYAAIEIRDNPSLAMHPVAVGGPTENRGVLCTCNYLARSYGVRSAMSTAYAYRLCPDLVVLPVNMPKYREVAKQIQVIFKDFTDLVEPLSLDEAYLDVSHVSTFSGSATWIAKEIQSRITDEIGLTASAGVAPNKFLAKIASGWKKPNGLFVIRPTDVDEFIKNLPIEKIFGVGKVTARKLHAAGFITCSDVHPIPFHELSERFGKLGQQLYYQSRGIDERPVEPNRPRKSLSVEKTFIHDILPTMDCVEELYDLHTRLLKRIQDNAITRPIKNQYLKIKFSDFKQKTIEISSHEINLLQYEWMLKEIRSRYQIPMRLLGIGVHFVDEVKIDSFKQLNLFE